MTKHTPVATVKSASFDEYADWLEATLAKEQDAAERTLGRQLVDPALFAFNCRSHGLAFALNHEQDIVDQADAASISSVRRIRIPRSLASPCWGPDNA